jgi:hypothetical protein
MEPMKVIGISGKNLRGSRESRRTSTDDPKHPDYFGGKFEFRDIPKQCELADQNLMKLPGGGLFARSSTWRTWGK